MCVHEHEHDATAETEDRGMAPAAADGVAWRRFHHMHGIAWFGFYLHRWCRKGRNCELLLIVYSKNGTGTPRQED